MLKMIDCDLFYENGTRRSPILFKNGLNIIEGVETNEEYNSIGKTTLLLIIDFAFGGKEYLKYVEKFPDDKRNHVIKFVMEFGYDEYFFTRSTNIDTSSFVSECNNDFQELRKISIKDYKEFLKEKYNLYQPELTFREAAGRFTRIAGMDTLDIHYPVQSANKEKLSDGIEAVIKLFDEYTALSKVIKDKEETEKKSSTLSYNSKNGWMKIPSEKEYEDLLEERDKLKQEQIKLFQLNKSGKANFESVNAARLYDLNKQVISYESELRRLNSLINERKEYKNFSSKFKKDMALINHYFNEKSVKTITEIETFHEKLAASLNKEFEKDNERIKQSIRFIEEQLALTKEEIDRLNIPQSVPEQILIQSGQITSRLNEIDNLIKNRDRKTAIEKQKEKLTIDLKDYYTLLFGKLNNMINRKIETYNALLTNKTSSLFTLIDDKHYSFENTTDSSTGSNNRGLICFDLALLKLTNLPYVIHDYDLIEPIESAVKNKLILLYNSCKDKQIFIVLKKENFYSTDSRSIIEKSKCITLSSNGQELFGEAWNKPAKN